MLAKPWKLIAVQWSATKLPNFFSPTARPPARPPPVVSQHAGNTQAPGNATRSPQHVEYRGPRCVSLICVIGRRIGLDRNTVSADITVFFPPHLKFSPWLVSLPSTLIPFYSLFTVSASALSPPAPTSPVSRPEPMRLAAYVTANTRY